MSLPKTRDYTAVDGVTNFPAATDIALQDACIREQSLRLGEGAAFYDDFFGSAADSGKWTFADATGAATFVGQAGACGTIRANVVADGSVFLETQAMDLGQRDFYWSARVKIVSVGGASSGLSLGLLNSAGALAAQFYFAPAIDATYWVARLGGTNHITTIAPVLGNWHTLEIERVAGVFNFYVDGVLAYTEAVAYTLSGCTIRWFPVRNTSGTTDTSLDYMKFLPTRL